MEGQSCHGISANIPSMQDKEDSINGHDYLLPYQASTENEMLFQLRNGREVGGISAGEGDKSCKKETNKISLKASFVLTVVRNPRI